MLKFYLQIKEKNKGFFFTYSPNEEKNKQELSFNQGNDLLDPRSAPREVKSSNVSKLNRKMWPLF